MNAWGSAQGIAFVHIKRLLIIVSARGLIFPDYKREFVVHVDTSELGVGAFPAQLSEKNHPNSSLDIIAYLSQRFNHGQRHYSASMKKCC